MRLVRKAICKEAEPVSESDFLNSESSCNDGREFWTLATIRLWILRPEEERTVSFDDDTCDNKEREMGQRRSPHWAAFWGFHQCARWFATFHLYSRTSISASNPRSARLNTLRVRFERFRVRFLLQHRKRDFVSAWFRRSDDTHATPWIKFTHLSGDSRKKKRERHATRRTGRGGHLRGASNKATLLR